MAGDWIKIRSNIKDDPDVIILAEKLSIDEFGAVGRLHAVWAWLDQHSKTGTNVRISSAYLDRLTACPGFADGMRAIGWLCGRDGDLEFPRFDRHNGDSSKNRAADSKRKQEDREAKEETRTNVRKNPDKCPKNSGLEKRREEKSILTLTSKNNARGVLSELKSFAVELGLPESDGESMFDHWEANGWRNGSSPSRDWRAGMRKWKSQGWLPSQKKTTAQNGRRANEYPQETLQLPD